MEDFDGRAVIIKGSELVLSDYQMTQLERGTLSRISRWRRKNYARPDKHMNKI